MRFRNLVLASAALCTASAFAAEIQTVNVPFSFVAKNHAYQPGAYSVSVDWSRSMVTLEPKGQPGVPLTWIMLPADSAKDAKVSLNFDVAGEDHTLRTIRYNKFAHPSAQPNLDKRPKRSVEGVVTVGE